MSGARLHQVFRLDYGQTFRRPLFWVWLVILGFTSMGLASGDMRIASGDAMVGGTKAWLTSEFSMSMMLSMVIFIFYMFFIAIAAGMTLIRDDDLKVGEVLHSTPLEPREYIWGKFGAALAGFLTVLAIHLVLAMFFNHLWPNASADEIRGPFDLLNYLRPALFFGIPAILFLSGITFAVGAWTRKPILVFIVPIALLLVVAFFLWDWSPHWLSPRWNNVLMWIEPSGFRWLNETWLKVDRGVEFYNTARVGFDAGFLLSRIALMAVGLGSVVFAERMFTRRLRGAQPVKAKDREALGPVVDTVRPVVTAPLAPLGMRQRAVGFLSGALAVARFEFQELKGSPGLYLFVPIIIIQVVIPALFQNGPFDTEMLLTPGMMATNTMNTSTLLVCFLLLFYTVESLQRERNTGIGSIFYASRVSTGSLLFGKALANGLVAGVVMLVSFLSILVAILVQGTVAFSVTPFLMTWVLVLIPTFIAWSAFVMALQAVTGNRYSTYALGLGVIILTGYLQMTGRMSWVGNWNAWAVVRWSDFGMFELNRTPLILNRILVLSLIPFFIAFTVRVFNRRDWDATRLIHRLQPLALLRGTAMLMPFLIVPLATGIFLQVNINRDFQGKGAEKKAKDYWRGNVETWKGAPLPAILQADVDVELFPEDRKLHSAGSYMLVNHLEERLHQVAFTAGQTWRDLTWTMDGEEAEPQEKAGLYVFTPETPLEPGAVLTVGWEGDSHMPRYTKNGGGVPEFVLPLGAVLTSFSSSFVPALGFDEQIGVDKDNRTDAKEWPPDFYEGVTRSGFGQGSDIPYPVRTRITVPQEYRANGVGVLVDESVINGKRTVVWESDHPVSFFNVVAGKWEERRGEGTVIYHHPDHTYNLDEMITALNGARKYYSEWFYEFPWEELKLSEFANLAGYAQGFPTNITFSEGIGFLTKSDEKSNAAFMVTAHEAAHQWWGNILTPGEGPGGNILSEGMAHFSTAMLIDEVQGPQQRMAFMRNIEDRYGERRQADSERELVRVDGSRPGDTTVTYDKGGWVFWMLLHAMGREAALAGYSAFIHEYSQGPDHAVLYDFVREMRSHAPDVAAYDTFVDQWFHDVVVPEYRIHDAERNELAGGGWEVTARIENRGTGTMAVDVAALRGERFPEGKKKEEGPELLSPATAVAAEGDEEDGEADEPYREARTTIVLSAGESVEVRIGCEFEPETLVVDPDVMVLQLNRKNAVEEF